MDLRLSRDTRRRIGLSADALVAVYLAGIVTWLALWQLVGDATWWLFTLNALAIYLFLPLPLALIAAVWRRKLALVGGSLAGLGLFALLWGGLFWPRGTPEPQGPVLVVMTYNVLGFNTNADDVVEVLRTSEADIIGLSELNSAVAAAIGSELRETYPYQLLEPDSRVHGSGVISRLPFEVVPAELSDPQWVSPPTALEVEFAGSRILFVRAHSASGAARLEARERQARLLSELAGQVGMPLIVAGDFNASDINHSYEVLTEHLDDAWRQAGAGLGNTFPGASREDSPGSSRPELFGIDLPKWLVRIDYVLYSDEWQAIDARIGPWDGQSDHRPVIAELALRAGR